MQIVMLGMGYVGLVSGACFSEFGTSVVCIDNQPDKIETLRNGRIPLYEPGLAQLVSRNVAAERLSFSSDLAQAMKDADAVFIAVGTSRPLDAFSEVLDTGLFSCA
jgi:UDPglucose 6-dehydrogenase